MGDIKEPTKHPLLQSAADLALMSDADIQSLGYSHWRRLPDGGLMAVCSMMFGNGRLFLEVSHHGYEDCFCYDSLEEAVDAMLAFEPERDEEPTGWKRHPYSGRRRPDGDAAQEFVAR